MAQLWIQDHNLSQRHRTLLLLNEIANRGRILRLARQTVPELYEQVLIRQHISAQNAAQCIELFDNLALITIAEQWNHERGGEPPTSATEALALVATWRRHCH